jgi:hypothetical protein
MKIGPYTLRKPWTKLVDVPIEEEIYWAIRKSIQEDIAKNNPPSRTPASWGDTPTSFEE